MKIKDYIILMMYLSYEPALHGNDRLVGRYGDPITGDDAHVNVLDVVSHHGAQQCQGPTLFKCSIALNFKH